MQIALFPAQLSPLSNTAEQPLNSAPRPSLQGAMQRSYPKLPNGAMRKTQFFTFQSSLFTALLRPSLRGAERRSNPEIPMAQRATARLVRTQLMWRACSSAHTPLCACAPTGSCSCAPSHACTCARTYTPARPCALTRAPRRAVVCASVRAHAPLRAPAHAGVPEHTRRRVATTKFGDFLQFLRQSGNFCENFALFFKFFLNFFAPSKNCCTASTNLLCVKYYTKRIAFCQCFSKTFDIIFQFFWKNFSQICKISARNLFLEFFCQLHK